MKEKLLVHACCAPCFIAPYQHLKNDFEIFGFWFNHNIHPYQEYEKRHESWLHFIEENNIKHIDKDEYQLEEFLQKASFREQERCYFCYYDRLKYAAVVARKGHIKKFTTTLLYSKFQRHELIKEIGYSLAQEYGLEFFYQDFRKYWKEGILLSKEKKMYRQQYCGCIYSEKERYMRKT